MMNWFLQLVFDEVDCVFIVNDLDLQYKKLNWFLGVSKVSYILGYNFKNLRLKVSNTWFLKRGALLYFIYAGGTIFLKRQTCCYISGNYRYINL